MEKVTALIRDIPDFPQPGIVFKDITPVLAHAEAFQSVITEVATAAQELHAERIVGIESRGFLFGAPVADRLRLGFVPVRKPGKLPAETLSVDYALEYGTNTVEIHTDALTQEQRVVIVDDVLATGGTAAATAHLVEQAGGVVAGFVFVIELGFLCGRERLSGYEVRSLIRY
jgi:adenine phosphoribosyltransferase